MDSRPDERGREVRPRLLTRLPARAALATAALFLISVASAPAAPLTGRVLVLRAPGAVAARAEIAAAGGRAVDGVPGLGLVTVRPPSGVSAPALARRLDGEPGILSAQPEHRMTARATPDDPALTRQDPGDAPGLSLQWYLLRENLPRAWGIESGADARVGVIDQGIDASHPEFAGKIAAAIDQQDPADSTGPAGTDQTGHGTWVAGAACARTGNGAGIAGAGRDCRLIFEKSDFSDTSVISSIYDATRRGARAINMSFGTDDATPAPDALVAALRFAARRKVVLVAAASDSPVTEQGYPSNVLQPTGTGPNVHQGLGLSVTAADERDQRASFAGHGTQISMAAYGAYRPGTGILPDQGSPGLFGLFPGNQTVYEAGFPPCGCRATLDGDDRYGYLQGTSMSAPQIAAVGALVRTLNPDLSLPEVLTLLKQTARRPTGAWSSDLGWGILDGGAALVAAARIDARAPTSQIRAPAATDQRVVLLHLTGRDRGPRGVRVSGVARFTVYARRGSGPVRRIGSTRGHTLRFRVAARSRYDFFSVATDHAGNTERRPRTAQARTRTAPRLR